jgi:hypothetical protein
MNEMKTCFKKVDYDLAGLLHYIDIGDACEYMSGTIRDLLQKSSSAARPSSQKTDINVRMKSA